MPRKIPLDVPLARGDRFWLWLAGRLPERLVYWCGVVMMANATTGLWAAQDMEKLTARAMLYRWARGNQG